MTPLWQLDDRVEPVGDLAMASVDSRTDSWAVKVDINSPVDDFYQRVPDMAYKVRLSTIPNTNVTQSYHFVCTFVCLTYINIHYMYSA